MELQSQGIDLAWKLVHAAARENTSGASPVPLTGIAFHHSQGETHDPNTF